MDRLTFAAPASLKGTSASVKKYWGLVKKHGSSRRKMIDFICGIGGYSAGRREQFAVEFNCKAYSAKLDVEDMWKFANSGDFDLGPERDLDPAKMAIAKALFWRVHKEQEDHLWQMGAEDALENFQQDDQSGTWLGIDVQWKYEIHGRSGGHLCMTECEGINLRCSPEDLEETLNERRDETSSGQPTGPWVFDYGRLQRLFIICVQNSVDITPENVSEQVTYHANWRLWASYIEDNLTAAFESYDTRERLSPQAAAILDIIGKYSEHADAFREICKLADITIEGE